MTNIDEQHEIVKKSLFQFVNTHIKAADLSVVDEIVLNYVISILEEASEDPHFDVDGFVEMMSAYFPDFSQIDTTAVYNWIFQLENQMSSEKIKEEKISHVSPKKTFRLADIIPEAKLLSKPPAQNDCMTEANEKHNNYVKSIDDSSNELNTCDLFTEECVALHEIFPESSILEIKHCITIANGDIDRATQIVLDRQEKGQSIAGSLINSQKNVAIDDNELKNRIISRYSYVDRSAETKQYKPVVPKIEPKKLVRYRDNKIVSLKGERYTEVRTDGETELRKPKKQPVSP